MNLSPTVPMQIISEHAPAVFVVVAIDTEVLPVGAVKRIVPAIAVFMVHGEEIPAFKVKLPPAFGANETVYLQRLFPVIRG